MEVTNQHRGRNTGDPPQREKLFPDDMALRRDIGSESREE